MEEVYTCTNCGYSTEAYKGRLPYDCPGCDEYNWCEKPDDIIWIYDDDDTGNYDDHNDLDY